MLKLRNTSETEIPCLQALEVAAAQRFLTVSELAVLASTEPTDRLTHAESIAQQLAWRVEDENGCILGFCYAQFLADGLYLAEISSHPDAHGRGVGRQLVAHVRRIAAKLRLNGVYLTTFIDVPWNAPWYRKQGFELLEPTLLSDELKEIMQMQQEAGLMLLPRGVMWAASIQEEDNMMLSGNKW